MAIVRATRGALAGTLALIGLFMPLAEASAQGKAQEAMPTPIAVVVDTVEALNASKAMAAIRDQYARFETQFRNQVAVDEKNLNDSARDLEQLKTTLGPEAFAERKRAFEASLVEYQRKSRALRVALEKSNRQAVNQVQQAMLEIIGDVAQQRGANIVLSKTQVVLYDPRMEITPQVVDGLNRKLPSVAFPTPIPESEAAAPARPAQPAPKKK